jgi:two-component system cell cycle sensor histidine kinase/response regulator CckA
VEWSEQLPASLLDGAPDAMVVVGEDGAIAFANVRAERMFGYAREAMLGKSIELLVPDSFRAVHAGYRSGGTGRPFALRARRADGAEFPTEVALSVIEAPDKHMVVMAVIRDDTARREAQRDKSLLASIVQSSHDAIVSTDLDGTVLTWNPGAERLYGYPAAEVLGRRSDFLVPPDRVADEAQVRMLVAGGGLVDRHIAYRIRRDGRQIPVSMLVSPLNDPDGGTVGVTTIARDISDRERFEAQMQAFLDATPDPLVGVDAAGRVVLVNGKAEQLFGYDRFEIMHMPILRLLPGGFADVLDSPEERLRAEAEQQRLEARLLRTQRLESLGQLAGGVAHDFNNLLAVILNYAAFIIEDGAGTPFAEDAEQIARAGRRGTELTHQLLAFARREVIRPRPLDVNTVVAEAVQMLSRSIGEHITLDARLADWLPPVMADPGQLEQVLVNLCVNARDAMPSGGQITVDTSFVDIEADLDGGHPAGLDPGRYVRLRVSDTGTGMPPEVIDRAFDPFFTTKPSGEGTGLGLATVYGIVTQAGGRVQIYSEAGLGTTITVLLPTTDEVVQADGADAAGDGLRGQGQVVLVVEDEEPLREVTGRILRRGGYTVLAAADGHEAIRLAGEQDGKIDVVLTDVIMPKMLGKEVVQRIREKLPAVRVLYMSGYAHPVLASHGTLDPDVYLLEKPFTSAELLTAIRDQLNLR